MLPNPAGLTSDSFGLEAGGRLMTPPLEDRILTSITRDRVIAETGAEEEVCTLDDDRSFVRQA